MPSRLSTLVLVCSKVKEEDKKSCKKKKLMMISPVLAKRFPEKRDTNYASPGPDTNFP